MHAALTGGFNVAFVVAAAFAAVGAVATVVGLPRVARARPAADTPAADAAAAPR